MASTRNIKELTDNSFEQEIQKGLTLVDFHANWCGPCRMLAPILEEVAQELKDKAIIAKVDIDTAQKIAAQFQITSVPTMILFKGGKEINRWVGLKRAEELKSLILAAV